MKAVYGKDAPSNNLKHWHRQFKCGCTSVETVPIPGRPYSTIDDATIPMAEATIWKDRHETERQLVHEVKINLGTVKKSSMTICTWEGVCLMDSTIAHTFTEARTGHQCAEALLTMYQDNKEDFFDRLQLQITKHGFITTIWRQNLNLSDGNIITRHLRKRYVSNPLWAKPC